MSDELHDHDDEADEAPLSAKTKAIMWVVGIVLVAGAAFLMVRMSSPLIPANATPPAGHFPLPCTTCHRLGPATATGATP